MTKKKRAVKTKKSMKKGVSPVVATVLLIMIVIVIAIILVLFFRSWFKDVYVKEVSGESKKVELFCSDVKLSAVLSSDGITISNEGNIPVKALSIKIVSNSGNSKTDPFEESISPGHTKLYTGSPAELNDATSIKIFPILLAKKTGSQELKAFTCPENNAIVVK